MSQFDDSRSIDVVDTDNGFVAVYIDGQLTREYVAGQAEDYLGILSAFYCGGVDVAIHTVDHLWFQDLEGGMPDDFASVETTGSIPLDFEEADDFEELDEKCPEYPEGHGIKILNGDSEIDQDFRMIYDEFTEKYATGG